jgi:hypothetical protein
MISPIIAQATHSNAELRVIVTVENVPTYVVDEEAGIAITVLRMMMDICNTCIILLGRGVSAVGNG